MEAYCVFHYCNEFVIMKYETFKANQYTSIVHFIGTYAECEGFVNRSVAKQELVNSANREHEETYTREEVYLIAERSVRAAISNILSNDNPKPISEIINSEIDTVKLF